MQVYNIGRRPRLLEAAAGSPMGRGRRRGHGAAQQQRKQSQAKPHLDAFLYFPLQPKFQELAWSTQFPPSFEASLKLRRKLLFTWSSVRVIHLQASWKSPHRTPGWMGQQREAGYPVRLSIQAKDRRSQQQGQGHSVTWIVFADSHSESQFYWFLSPVFFKFASAFHSIVSSMDPQYTHFPEVERPTGVKHLLQIYILRFFVQWFVKSSREMEGWYWT